MKIINYKSGLGNQIFYYLFTLYMMQKYPQHNIYGYYVTKFLKKHNGLEIANVFDVELPPQTYFSKIVGTLCRKLNGIGIKGLKSQDDPFVETATYYDGWWQDKKYFLDNVKRLKFKNIKHDSINDKLVEKIKNTYSVSIHIRRGDFLLNSRYSNIATVLYYKKAIEYITKIHPDAQYFVFSNDMDWVKTNIEIPSATYVTNNFGPNSYMDMYLMTKCDANIIANSSFSYWGAMLNEHADSLTVYPAIWDNELTPDMFPDNWVVINGRE